MKLKNLGDRVIHMSPSMSFLISAALLILVTLACCVEVFFNIQSMTSYTLAEDDSTTFAAESSQIAYTPSSLASYETPHAYYAEDGYNNLDDWWADLHAIQEDSKEMADNLVDSYGSYLSAEDEARLYEIEKEIRNGHSVLACLDLLDEANSIVTSSLPVVSYSSSYSGSSYSGNFKRDGVIYANNWRYTWYSQRVLPGGGLSIPGRHVGEDGLIRDADGYIVVASGSLSKGSEVDTPFGMGKVYDSGCAADTIDIYTDY